MLSDLLIVIAIIAIHMAILFPVFAAAHDHESMSGFTGSPPCGVAP